MSRTNYGTRVTPENVEQIISFVKDFDLNVDYIKDNLEYHTEDGDVLYVIFSCNDETGNKTFTEMIEPDFFASWRFVHPETTTAPWLQIIDRNL